MKESENINTASAYTVNDNQAIVEIKNLCKSFGSQEVLKGLNIEVMKGENLVVLGKSGTGKSVLIKCIVGLLEPDAGSIIVMDSDLKNLDHKGLNNLRKKIGFLFQGGALYDSMTVKQNLEFPLKRVRKELTSTEIMSKIEEVLENVGLADALNKMPSQLSGGMRKRIALARTIVVDPVLMLYDEPTTGLDPVTSDEISQLINEVQKKYNTSSIIITHDISCARTTGNSIAMLKDGEVYVKGNYDELSNSSDPWVKTFFN
ncbi:MAG: ATP-binding cassette domain-containing protein [Bacteroidia bacterium]